MCLGCGGAPGLVLVVFRVVALRRAVVGARPLVLPVPLLVLGWPGFAPGRSVGQTTRGGGLLVRAWPVVQELIVDVETSGAGGGGGGGGGGGREKRSGAAPKKAESGGGRGYGWHRCDRAKNRRE